MARHHNKGIFLACYRAQNAEGRESLKKEADHCRLPRGSFNKQENFLTRLVLGSHNMSKSSHTHTPNLKSLYRGLNWVQSHCHPDSLNTTFYLKAVSLEKLLKIGDASVQGQRRRWGASSWLNPAHRSTSSHISSMTAPHTHCKRQKETHIPSSYIPLAEISHMAPSNCKRGSGK